MGLTAIDLHVKRVVEVDIDLVRRIRNSGKDGFSNDTSIITEEQQKEWWKNNEEKCIAFLFSDKEVVCGYCMVRYENDKWWDSIAVLSEFRGKGYGKWMLHYTITHVPYDVWSTIRLDNMASIKIHVKEDWERVGLGFNDECVIFHTWSGRK